MKHHHHIVVDPESVSFAFFEIIASVERVWQFNSFQLAEFDGVFLSNLHFARFRYINRNLAAELLYIRENVTSYLPKRKNPSVTPLQNPSVGFQSKIKNQARSQ